MLDHAQAAGIVRSDVTTADVLARMTPSTGRSGEHNVAATATTGCSLTSTSGNDFAEVMLSEGHARLYDGSSSARQDAYDDATNDATDARVGVWGGVPLTYIGGGVTVLCASLLT